MDFDRYVRPDPGQDAFIADVKTIIDQGAFQDLFTFAPISTTKSSIEVMFERRSGEAVLVWDIDCLDRLDGLLAFCLAEDGDIDHFKSLGVIALSHLTAGYLLKTDPAVATQIMTLAYEVEPHDLTFTVDDDARLDRYQRLMRVYLFFHEIGHIVYRSKADGFEAVNESVERAIAAFQNVDVEAGEINRSPEAEARIARGLSIPINDLPGLHAQIEQDMSNPRTREETWCDAFAATYMLNWAVDQGFNPIECYAVDALLHLFIGARFQWLSYWDRSNTNDKWDATPSLATLEARVFVRSLIMYAECFQHWKDTEFGKAAGGDNEEAQLSAFHQLTDQVRDPLLDAYHARINLALGLLNLFDRREAFERADSYWQSLSEAEQSQTIDDLIHDLY